MSVNLHGDPKGNLRFCQAFRLQMKEHRNIDSISDDHIYTCFRSIGWPTNIPDFVQPLRDLKFKKYFTSPEKGFYAINHIGLDYVKKLGGGDGAS